MVSSRRFRNWARMRASSFLRPYVPGRVLAFLAHSVHVPFGDRYYDDRAKNYDFDRQDQPSWSAEYDALLEMGRQAGRGLKALDVPVGTGRFFPIYRELDWTVTGLDISDDMLEVAAAKAELLGLADCELLRGSALSLPFADDSFDVVVCFRFLQAIVSFEDAKAIVKEFSRVSKRFVILHLDALEGSNLPNRPGVRMNETMRGKLRWSEIEEWLESSGLKSLEKVGLQSHPNRSEFVVRLEVVPSSTSQT